MESGNFTIIAGEELNIIANEIEFNSTGDIINIAAKKVIQNSKSEQIEFGDYKPITIDETEKELDLFPGEFIFKEGKKIYVSPMLEEENIQIVHYLEGDNKNYTQIINLENNYVNWITNGVNYIWNYQHHGDKYAKREVNTNWQDIYNEWKDETGPTNSIIYKRDQTMIKDIRKSNLYLSIRNDYIELQRKEPETNKKMLTISFAKWLKGLQAVLLSGNNMTMQMLGTVNISFYDIGNYKRFVLITDSKSVESFNRLGIDISKFLKKVPTRITRQTYIWVDYNIEG